MKKRSIQEVMRLLSKPIEIRPGVTSRVECQPLRIEDDFAVTGAALDSRHIQSGFIFAAFQGENCHGLDHVESAWKSGASVVLTEIGAGARVKGPTLEVPNVKEALVHLATAVRNEDRSSASSGLKTVAVTGSVGKTTTCHVGSLLCDSHFQVHSPRDSFNNLLGVPITILEAAESTNCLWLEMGTNSPGEIAQLVDIGQPDIGVVTAVGATHLEGLGSVEGVFREKFSLFDVESLQWGIAPVEFRDERLETLNGAHSGTDFIWTGPGGDLEIQNDSSHEITVIDRRSDLKFPIETSMTGYGFLRCLESSIAVALQLGISASDIQQVASSLTLPPMRAEVHDVKGIQFILDCYNASPPSVRGAICDLAQSVGGRRIAVLGTMEELGPEEKRYHQEMGRACVEEGLDFIVAWGRAADWIADGVTSAGGICESPSDLESALSFLSSELKVGDRVLFKASRKEKLELMAQQLKANWLTLTPESRSGEARQ
ncbi:Mur ligase family protein [Planctomycetota bacterium]|nr:Mur ligase family protein [Planctomycetota bacterium]